MPKLRGAQVAATLVAALLAAGCSGEARTSGDSAASTPTTQTPSAPTPSSPTSSASPTPTRPEGEASNCLFTDAQVSRVLGGTWERDPFAPGDPCEYSSDRRAGFVTYNVDEPIKLGLRVARRLCLAGVKPINVAGGGFVCVERKGSDDYVIGTVGARGRLWLLVMVPKSERTHRAELTTMAALARAAPK